MELIRNIGIKAVVNSKGNLNSYTYGIFKCPVCSSEVERPITKGSRNKSCGDKECRKAVGSFNTYDRISEHKHYQSIKRHYDSLNIKCERNEFANFKEFFDLVNEQYTSTRTTTNAIVRIELTNNILCKDSIIINSYDESTIETNNNKILQDRLDNKKYDSEVIAYVTRKTTHYTNRYVDTYMKNEDKSYYIYDLYNRSVKSILLTELQFNNIIKLIEFNSQKNKSNKLYIVESNGYIKVGITHDIQKRLKQLNASSPNEAVLIKEYEIDNARECEAYIHNKYKDLNHKYEWFKLDESQVEELIKIIELNIESSTWLTPKANIATKEYRVYKQKQLEDKPKIKTVTDQIRVARTGNKTHWMTNHPVYSAWQTMKKRAFERNVQVCERWNDSEMFIADNIEKYESLLDTYKRTNSGSDKPALQLDETEEYNNSTVRFTKFGIVCNTSKVVIGIKDGIETEHKSAIKAAVEVRGIPGKITECCKGKRKSHAGYEWKYKE